MADREGSQFVSQCVIHFANPPVFVLPHIFHSHYCKTNLRVAFHSFVSAFSSDLQDGAGAAGLSGHAGKSTTTSQ